MIDTAVRFGANRFDAELEMADALSFELLLVNVRILLINLIIKICDGSKAFFFCCCLGNDCS